MDGLGSGIGAVGQVAMAPFKVVGFCYEAAEDTIATRARKKEQEAQNERNLRIHYAEEIASLRALNRVLEDRMRNTIHYSVARVCQEEIRKNNLVIEDLLRRI